MLVIASFFPFSSLFSLSPLAHLETFAYMPSTVKSEQNLDRRLVTELVLLPVRLRRGFLLFFYSYVLNYCNKK